LESVSDFVLYRLLLDDQEVPWLHKANGRCMVGGGQDLGQNFIGNRIAQELAADVAAGENGAVDGLAFFTGKWCNGCEAVGVFWHRGSPSDAVWRSTILHEGTTFPAWPVF
jgi:hypothetical protein